MTVEIDAENAGVENNNDDYHRLKRKNRISRVSTQMAQVYQEQFWATRDAHPVNPVFIMVGVGEIEDLENDDPSMISQSLNDED